MWAAGRNTSMSKACAIVVTRTYIGEVLLGPLHVQTSCKPLDAERGLESIVHTSQCAEDIDSTPMEGQGLRGNQWEGVQSHTKPIAATRGLQAGIQARAKRVQ